tara:strand:+ start:41 stop:484 length:444 start_codon:yes stop_codon:yes gene_type:complete
MSINFVGNLAQDLPAKILQVVRSHTTSEFNANSTTFQNTLSCSITLKSGSSHCLVIFQPVRLVMGGSTNGLYRLMNTTQGNAGMNTYRIAYAGSGYKNPNMIFNYGTTLTAGNTYTFHLQARTTTADTNILGDNGSTSSTTILEYIP